MAQIKKNCANPRVLLTEPAKPCMLHIFTYQKKIDAPYQFDITSGPHTIISKIEVLHITIDQKILDNSIITVENGYNT